MDFKPIAIYLPIIAALGWGLAYAVNAKNYEVISVPTGLITHGLAVCAAGVMLSVMLKAPVDFTAFFSGEDVLWYWVAPLATMIASMGLHLSLKYNSATYTGLVEILYMLFIPLFAYLLFGQKQLNLSMMIGGALTLVGIGFVVAGQLQKSS